MKTKTKMLLLALGVIAIAATAWAADIDEKLQLRVISRLWVGGNRAQLTSANGITKSIGARTLYNFPDLVQHCKYSWPVTMTGAGVGDPCFVGADVVPPENYSVGCIVTAADTAKVFACATQADGGAVDPADSGYYLRVLSSQ